MVTQTEEPVAPIADGSPGPRRDLRIDNPDGCLMVAEVPTA